MTAKRSHLIICRHRDKEDMSHMISVFTVENSGFILALHIDARRDLSEN